MDTYTRLNIYAQGRKTISARQRRRLVKKAGRDPYALVTRDDGMGYPPRMQGYRELTGCEPAPKASAGTGRGHEAIDAWVDEVADHEAERYRQGVNFS